MNNIKLGTGIGDIKFGIKPDKLINLIGEPNVIDEPADEDGLLILHYDDLNLSFGFSTALDGNLLSITTSNDNAKLEDISFIGNPLQEVLDKLEIFNFGDIDIEDISTEETPNQQLLTVFEYSLNFWFDDNELAEIQWGPFWDIEKDKPVWP